jgi:putative oxidoreductase
MMSILIDTGILVVRIALGVIFIAHGMQKCFGAFGGPGIDGFSGSVKMLGFNPPLVWAWIAAGSELAGGLFTLFGVLPRMGAALIAMVMVVAITKVHGPKGFFLMQGGFEYAFLILMVCISLMITGAGRFSLLNKL